MRLLAFFDDPDGAAALNRRLRAAGIMTRIGGIDPHTYRPPRADAIQVGLWVVLDEQYADAIKLLDDPAHVPRRVLSATEMDAIERAAERRSRDPVRRWLDRALTLVLGACLFGLILYTLIDFLRQS